MTRIFEVMKLGSVVAVALLGSMSLAGADRVAGLPPRLVEVLEKQESFWASSRLVYEEKLEFGSREESNRHRKVTFNFRDGKFHAETIHYPVRAMNRPERIDEVAFDGEFMYVGSPVGQHAYLMKGLPGDETDPWADRKGFGESRYLEAMGVYSPSTMADAFKQPRPKSMILWLAEQGDFSTSWEEGILKLEFEVPDLNAADEQAVSARKKRRELEKRNELIQADKLNLPEVDVDATMRRWEDRRAQSPVQRQVFCLDREQEFRLVERFVFNGAGKLVEHTMPANWRTYGDDGVAVPSQCRTLMYFDTHSGEITSEAFCVMTHELKRLQLEGDPNAAYRLSDEAVYNEMGTTIADRSSEAARHSPRHEVQFVVGGDGTLLERESRSTLEEIRAGRARVFYAILCVAFFVPLVSVWRWRQGRGRR